MEEQEEMKRDLVAMLDAQSKSSLSARFQRRQKTSEHQEEADRRWQRVQARTTAKVEVKVQIDKVVANNIGLKN